MNEQEIEQVLEEKTEEIQTKDFQLVWDEIKDKVVVPKASRKKWKWISIAASVVGLVITGCLVLPNLLKDPSNEDPGPELIFLAEQLTSVAVSEQEFYTAINEAHINYVDVSSYDVLNYALWKTDENEVKGGIFDFCDDENNPSFFIILNVYDKNVEFEENLYADYNQVLETVNGANVQYKLDTYSEEDGLYVYRAKVEFNDSQYVIEYNTFEDNITQFLEDFFK